MSRIAELFKMVSEDGRSMVSIGILAAIIDTPS
jgi:hypothetical protein